MYRRPMYLVAIFIMVNIGIHEIKGQRPPTQGRYPTRAPTPGLDAKIIDARSIRPNRPVTMAPAIRPSTRPTKSSTTESSTTKSSTTKSSTTTDSDDKREVPQPKVPVVQRPTRIVPSRNVSYRATSARPRFIERLHPMFEPPAMPVPSDSPPIGNIPDPNVYGPGTNNQPNQPNLRPEVYREVPPNQPPTYYPAVIEPRLIVTLTPEKRRNPMLLPPETPAPSTVLPYTPPPATRPTLKLTPKPTPKPTPRPNREITSQKSPIKSYGTTNRIPKPTTTVIDEVQFISFTINNDYNKTVKDKVNLANKLTRSIALAANVRDARITNLELTPGSIVVDFQIEPGFEDETSAKQAAKIFKATLERSGMKISSPEGVPLEIDPNSVIVSDSKILTPEQAARKETMIEIKYILIVVVSTVAAALVLILVTVICLRNNSEKDDDKEFTYLQGKGSQRESHRDSQRDSRIVSIVHTPGKYRMDTASDFGFQEERYKI